jgi:uncharacterized protein (TIGR03437 family)
MYRMAVARQTASAHAASFTTSLAKETIASAFGNGLATGIAQAAAVPLPTTLGGTSLKVRDSAGVERLAPLFFVSPGQVNYQIPPDTAPGLATVVITSGDGIASIGQMAISPVAPGLFTANSGGTGVAAAVAVHAVGGVQTTELIANPDGTSRPINIGPPNDAVALSLFGTGIRARSSLSAVTVTIGSVNAQVLFAGAQSNFIGLDQVNVLIPTSLIGRGEVDLVMTVDNVRANTVRVNIK